MVFTYIRRGAMPQCCDAMRWACWWGGRPHHVGRVRGVLEHVVGLVGQACVYSCVCEFVCSCVCSCVLYVHVCVCVFACDRHARARVCMCVCAWPSCVCVPTGLHLGDLAADRDEGVAEAVHLVPMSKSVCVLKCVYTCVYTCVCVRHSQGLRLCGLHHERARHLCLCRFVCVCVCVCDCVYVCHKGLSCVCECFCRPPARTWSGRGGCSPAGAWRYPPP